MSWRALCCLATTILAGCGGDGPASPSNQRPQADAGEDRIVIQGDRVQLDGRASRDPDGDALRYNWSLLSAPAASVAVIENPDAPMATLTLDRLGVYEVRLIVNDGMQDSLPAEIRLEAIRHTALQVIESFPFPRADTSSPHGLAFDGMRLWAAAYEENRIYELDTNGRVISSFDAPGDRVTGLTFDGQSLWSADDQTLRIYRLDRTGNVSESFEAPGGDSTGLTFDGRDLWNADFSSSGRIHRLSVSGALIRSFAAPAGGPEGLAFDGTTLWHVDFFEHKVYRLDLSARVLATFESPAENPIGLTYDGQFLWLASQSVRRIFKMQIVPLDRSGS